MRGLSRPWSPLEGLGRELSFLPVPLWEGARRLSDTGSWAFAPAPQVFGEKHVTQAQPFSTTACQPGLSAWLGGYFPVCEMEVRRPACRVGVVTSSLQRLWQVSARGGTPSVALALVTTSCLCTRSTLLSRRPLPSPLHPCHELLLIPQGPAQMSPLIQGLCTPCRSELLVFGVPEGPEPPSLVFTLPITVLDRGPLWSRLQNGSWLGRFTSGSESSYPVGCCICGATGPRAWSCPLLRWPITVIPSLRQCLQNAQCLVGNDQGTHSLINWLMSAARMV